MQQWFCLFFAIFFEVVATTSLKLSNGFTRLWPSLAVVVGYVLSFWAISIAMKSIPLSIVYPMWAGLGTVLVVLCGLVFFNEPINLTKIIGVLIIVTGVIILNLSGVHRFAS